MANRAVAGSRLGARTALLSQLGDDPLGLHMMVTLAAEPDLDLSWLRCTPGFQSPVTVSLTGMHEREFITYQEEADPLEWPVGRPSVGATHVSMQRELPDWVARLRQRGHGGLRRRGLGLQRSVVPQRCCGGSTRSTSSCRTTSKPCATPRPTTSYAAARELGRYVELAVVTRGARGVVAYERSTGQLTEVPAVNVTAVDPTGAGDVFVASFMASGVLDWPIEQRLRLAGLAASLSVRTLGGAASAPLSLRHQPVPDRRVAARGLVDHQLLGGDPSAPTLRPPMTLSTT